MSFDTFLIFLISLRANVATTLALHLYSHSCFRYSIIKIVLTKLENFGNNISIATRLSQTLTNAENVVRSRSNFR